MRRNVLAATFLAVVLASSHAVAGRPVDQKVCGDDLVSIGEKIVVERDEVIAGDVVCIGADIKILGTVKGDVVSVCGDLSLQETAIIEGDAVAVGGSIEKHKDAKVHGESVSIGISINVDLGGSDARSSI